MLSNNNNDNNNNYEAEQATQIDEANTGSVALSHHNKLNRTHEWLKLISVDETNKTLYFQIVAPKEFIDRAAEIKKETPRSIFLISLKASIKKRLAKNKIVSVVKKKEFEEKIKSTHPEVDENMLIKVKLDGPIEIDGKKYYHDDSTTSLAFKLEVSFRTFFDCACYHKYSMEDKNKRYLEVITEMEQYIARRDNLKLTSPEPETASPETETTSSPIISIPREIASRKRTSRKRTSQQAEPVPQVEINICRPDTEPLAAQALSVEAGVPSSVIDTNDTDNALNSSISPARHTWLKLIGGDEDNKTLYFEFTPSSEYRKRKADRIVANRPKPPRAEAYYAHEINQQLKHHNLPVKMSAAIKPKEEKQIRLLYPDIDISRLIKVTFSGPIEIRNKKLYLDSDQGSVLFNLEVSLRTFLNLYKGPKTFEGSEKINHAVREMEQFVMGQRHFSGRSLASDITTITTTTTTTTITRTDASVNPAASPMMTSPSPSRSVIRCPSMSPSPSPSRRQLSSSTSPSLRNEEFSGTTAQLHQSFQANSPSPSVQPQKRFCGVDNSATIILPPISANKENSYVLPPLANFLQFRNQLPDRVGQHNTSSANNSNDDEINKNTLAPFRFNLD